MLVRIVRGSKLMPGVNRTSSTSSRIDRLNHVGALTSFFSSAPQSHTAYLSEDRIQEFLKFSNSLKIEDSARLTQDLLLVAESILANFPQYAQDFLYSTNGTWEKGLDKSMREITLLICDNMGTLDSPKELLSLGEFAASTLREPDFAILSQVVRRSGELLSEFSPSEFVCLLQLCSRLDFMDSDFNEAVQRTLPVSIDRFGDNQYPVIFASVLRLGMDQPVDRLPQSVAEAPPSPLMTALIAEMIPRVPRMAAAGCLTILHSIVRRPRSKISPEMISLVHAIADTAKLEEWGLAMRIQAVHALSRLGVENQPAIASMFLAVTPETICRIPSANLQHLLSIIHNHAEHHSKNVWQPVLRTTMDRIGHPMIAKSMPLATIAVTLGYLGRLGLKNEGVVNQLLSVFSGAKPAVAKRDFRDRISLKMVERILTDPQVDIAHLTSVVEAIDRLDMWHLPLAVPFAMLTRRILIRDGIHNVKATPLCQLARVLMRTDLVLSDDDVRIIDSVIDAHIQTVAARGTVSTNWALQSKSEPVPENWRLFAVLSLLEGLLKHEKYIRSTQSVIERCVELRQMIKSGSTIVKWSDLPSNLATLLDTVEEPLDE